MDSSLKYFLKVKTLTSKRLSINLSIRFNYINDNLSVRIFGPGCFYRLVIQTRRDDRMIKVERRAVIASALRLELSYQASI